MKLLRGVCFWLAILATVDASFFFAFKEYGYGFLSLACVFADLYCFSYFDAIIEEREKAEAKVKETS